MLLHTNSYGVPLLKGFPILLAALPVMAFMLFQKTTRTIPALSRFNRKDFWPELRIDLFLLLIGWFVAVFGLYVMYEWTAMRFMDPMFIIVTRFYISALLPVAVFAAFLLVKLPDRFLWPLMVVILFIGGLLFAQSSVVALM